jgi:hypothetical protein
MKEKSGEIRNSTPEKAKITIPTATNFLPRILEVSDLKL